MNMLGNILWRVLADANRARKKTAQGCDSPSGTSFDNGNTIFDNSNTFGYVEHRGTASRASPIKNQTCVQFSPKPSIVRAAEIIPCQHDRQRSPGSGELVEALWRLEAFDGPGLIPAAVLLARLVSGHQVMSDDGMRPYAKLTCTSFSAAVEKGGERSEGHACAVSIRSPMIAGYPPAGIGAPESREGGGAAVTERLSRALRKVITGERDDGASLR